MPVPLKASHQIHTLARDLGVKVNGDPVEGILSYCDAKVEDFMSTFPDCPTLSSMLNWVAARVGTIFEIIDSDASLRELKGKYLERGEKRFTVLEDELATEDDFGVTLKLQNREPWEPEYVSIIDRRGDKASRAYFTKWHEIAHLLTLTSQGRLVFRRSHSSKETSNPEERLMDIIAGRFGFYPAIVQKFIKDEISFEVIDTLRDQLCPEASFQASLINFTKFWPTPCILLCAEMRLKKDEEANLAQQNFFFSEGPQARLRAAKVTCSNSARETGFTIHKNMRVPEQSVISHVFHEDLLHDEAVENLSWWESKGRHQSDCQVIVKARRTCDAVEALIIPKPSVH
jgi:hypothetical protein